MGNEEYNQGKAKITPDIFDGCSKTQNAEVFIENMKNTKTRHLLKKNKTEKMEIESELAEADECDRIKASNKSKELVIMDIDPKNFDKKDHIFMEFFSMYGKNFIDDKRQYE